MGMWSKCFKFWLTINYYVSRLIFYRQIFQLFVVYVNVKLVLQLKEFDKEMDDFCMKLFEFPIHFPPSYPFIEDSSNENSDYMETRCPAWCDRVLLSQSARPLVHGVSQSDILASKYTRNGFQMKWYHRMPHANWFFSVSGWRMQYRIWIDR